MDFEKAFQDGALARISAATAREMLEVLERVGNDVEEDDSSNEEGYDSPPGRPGHSQEIEQPSPSLEPRGSQQEDDYFPNNASKRSDAGVMGSVLERFEQWEARRQQKTIDLKKSQRNDEPQYSFRPELPSKRTFKYQTSQRLEERMEEWARRREEKLWRNRQMEIRKGNEDCTFQPQITKRGRLVESKVKVYTTQRSSTERAQESVSRQEKGLARFLQRQEKAREKLKESRDVPHATGQKFTGEITTPIQPYLRTSNRRRRESPNSQVQLKQDKEQQSSSSRSQGKREDTRTGYDWTMYKREVEALVGPLSGTHSDEDDSPAAAPPRFTTPSTLASPLRGTTPYSSLIERGSPSILRATRQARSKLRSPRPTSRSRSRPKSKSPNQSTTPSKADKTQGPHALRQSPEKQSRKSNPKDRQDAQVRFSQSIETHIIPGRNNTSPEGLRIHIPNKPISPRLQGKPGNTPGRRPAYAPTVEPSAGAAGARAFDASAGQRPSPNKVLKNAFTGFGSAMYSQTYESKAHRNLEEPLPPKDRPFRPDETTEVEELEERMDPHEDADFPSTDMDTSKPSAGINLRFRDEEEFHFPKPSQRNIREHENQGPPSAAAATRQPIQTDAVQAGASDDEELLSLRGELEMLRRQLEEEKLRASTSSEGGEAVREANGREEPARSDAPTTASRPVTHNPAPNGERGKTGKGASEGTLGSSGASIEIDFDNFNMDDMIAQVRKRASEIAKQTVAK